MCFDIDGATLRCAGLHTRRGTFALHPVAHPIEVERVNDWSPTVSDAKVSGNGSRSGRSSGTPRVTTDAASMPQLEPLGADAASLPTPSVAADMITYRGRPLVLPAQRLLLPALFACGRKLVRFVGWLISAVCAIVPVSFGFQVTDELEER